MAPVLDPYRLQDAEKKMAKLDRLCVYCGSSNAIRPDFLEAAYRFGRILGEAHIQLIYGGGRVGMMGRVADGCLEAGGSVVGIIPRHLHDREVAHHGISELVIVDTMHQRKMAMADRADGFAGLPGGFGTLDEMFEIVTWRQLGLHDKPIVFANIGGYWNSLVQMVATMAAAGFVAADMRYFAVVDAIEAILPAFQAATEPRRESDIGRL